MIRPLCRLSHSEMWNTNYPIEPCPTKANVCSVITPTKTPTSSNIWLVNKRRPTTKDGKHRWPGLKKRLAFKRKPTSSSSNVKTESLSWKTTIKNAMKDCGSSSKVQKKNKKYNCNCKALVKWSIVKKQKPFIPSVSSSRASNNSCRTINKIALITTSKTSKSVSSPWQKSKMLLILKTKYCTRWTSETKTQALA